jgi:hypothetical protein
MGMDSAIWRRLIRISYVNAPGVHRAEGTSILGEVAFRGRDICDDASASGIPGYLNLSCHVLWND